MSAICPPPRGRGGPEHSGLQMQGTEPPAGAVEQAPAGGVGAPEGWSGRRQPPHAGPHSRPEGGGRPGAGGGGSDFMCWAPGSGRTGQRRRPPVRGEWVLPRPVRTHQVLLLPTKNLDERSDVSDQGLNFMARIIHILKPQGNEKPCRSGQ